MRAKQLAGTTDTKEEETLNSINRTRGPFRDSAWSHDNNNPAQAESRSREGKRERREIFVLFISNRSKWCLSIIYHEPNLSRRFFLSAFPLLLPPAPLREPINSASSLVVVSDYQLGVEKFCAQNGKLIAIGYETMFRCIGFSSNDVSF